MIPRTGLEREKGETDNELEKNRRCSWEGGKNREEIFPGKQARLLSAQTRTL